VLSAGIEPAIPVIEQTQNYALDRKQGPVLASLKRYIKFGRFSAVRKKQTGLTESQNPSTQIVPENV
jgi:hypothetical protein